jgi:hypothetical protein
LLLAFVKVFVSERPRQKLSLLRITEENVRVVHILDLLVALDDIYIVYFLELASSAKHTDFVFISVQKALPTCAEG